MCAPVRSLAFWLLVLLTGCRGDEAGKAVPVADQDSTPAPAVALWTFEDSDEDGPPCVWRRIATGEPTPQELARFPARCDDVDLAWSGAAAIAWLSSRGEDHLFAVTLGQGPEAPTPLPPPPDRGVVRAVGFDDVPLVFTSLTRSDEKHMTTWAWVDGAWQDRERGSHGLRELAIWKGQRGQSARKRREAFTAKPMAPAEVATFDNVTGDERAIADITESIDEALATGTAVPVDGGVVIAMKKSTARWWELDIAGERIAIRKREDRFIADLRRFADGAWEHMAKPNVGLDRNEYYRVGIEVQGQMFLLSSDGRGPVLVDAKTGLTPWGNREFALAVFAP
ncbi:MAG: hypothetical protein SFX73_15665 [Kofleriaceae bacterium]|nr:hypothetical protein [Kofleriaceae bacterium]